MQLVPFHWIPPDVELPCGLTPLRYLESVHPGYERGKLERIVSSSRCHKARLLHYFPVDKLPQHADETPKTEGANLDDVDFSDWCGWHHDHSSLTGVTALHL